MSKIIPLTKGKFALVDDEDFDWLSQWKWYETNGYAGRNVGKRGNQKRIYMHVLIMQPPAGMEVDHIHGNTLDNRRSEMRLATGVQNTTNSKIRSDNTSGYKGVTYRKDRGVWWAQIRHNEKYEFLGSFSTPELAGRAYDKAAQKYFGIFAKLNFPDQFV